MCAPNKGNVSWGLHHLRKTPGSTRSRHRVGRGEGSGWGKTAGRGNKGQRARKGSRRRAGFEGGQMRLIRRLPKRGFKPPVRYPVAVVNVGDLSCFDDGTEVTPAQMQHVGLVPNRQTRVKILGTGPLSRRLLVKAHAFSSGARVKIEAAGGRCEMIRR